MFLNGNFFDIVLWQEEVKKKNNRWKGIKNRPKVFNFIEIIFFHRFCHRIDRCSLYNIHTIYIDNWFSTWIVFFFFCKKWHEGRYYKDIKIGKIYAHTKWEEKNRHTTMRIRYENKSLKNRWIGLIHPHIFSRYVGILQRNSIAVKNRLQLLAIAIVFCKNKPFET